MENKDTTDILTGLLPKYENLGKNVVQAIKLLLDKYEIKYVSIYYRVKDLNSFLEKIERKSYKNPLIEIEDICGIRIICYYQSDIEKISKIISEEFVIIESEDKEGKLNADQFGYRSLHFIASIRPEWGKVPNYNGLEDLRAEIQVRTILMHAWAEIEHNLAYKSEAQTPEKFKRKLFRISAKLEEADEQFEDLKKESKEYQQDLIKKVKSKKFKFDEETPLNLDTLQAFLDFYFPDRTKDIKSTSLLLEDVLNYNFTFRDLSEAYVILEPNLRDMEKESFNNENRKFAQVGMARLIMDIINDEYSRRFSDSQYNTITNIREKYYTNILAGKK